MPPPPVRDDTEAPVPTASGAPSVQERITHRTYAVTGRTADAVLRSLMDQGPRDGDDIFFGLTQTDFDVHYDPRPISGGCLIEDTRVSIDVVITLPEWLPATEVDTGLQVKWGQFRRALAAHEQRHREIAIDGAEAAYDAIAGLYRASCDAAVSEARARLDRVGVEVVAAHQRFDEETQHGKTTGAYWPQ